MAVHQCNPICSHAQLSARALHAVTTFEAKYCAACQGLLRTMALIPPKTLKERVKDCVRTRSYDLTTAFVAAQPVVIGQSLVQALLISPDVMDMGNIPSFEQASKILGAISRHIETNPEPALKCFIMVLRESNDASLRKIADDMAQESKGCMVVLYDSVTCMITVCFYCV